MTIQELKDINPELNAVELREGGRYLICIEKPMQIHVIEAITSQLRRAAESHGIKIVGVINLVPRIFELKADE